MARKKNQATSAGDSPRGQHSSTWDASSTASSATTYTTCAEQFHTDTVDTVCGKALEDLFEKRATTREKAFAALLSFFTQDLRDHEASEHESTIVARCINGIRRGGPVEACIAAQLLTLLAMSLPRPSDSLFQETQYDLWRAATQGEITEVQCAAIQCCAMLCWVAAEDDHHVLAVADKLRSLWASGDGKVAAAAMQAWCLLFTRLPPEGLQGQAIDTVLRQLAEALCCSDTQVRAAAGSALALVYHTCNLGGVVSSLAAQEQDAEWEGQGDDQLDPPQPVTEQSSDDDEGALGSMVGQLRQLATTGNHSGEQWRRSRRDKALTRGAFRAVLAVVEQASVPVTKIKLQQGDMLVVDTLRGNVLLDAFRRVLASGLQVHLQCNPLLHTSLDFVPLAERGPRLSTFEKRQTRSPSSMDSRWRTAERKGARQHKSARTAFVAEED